MDTKETVLVNDFSECLPGEAAERTVNVKHNLLSYFGQKFGDLFTLHCCIHFGSFFFLNNFSDRKVF
jgi:hypothetical protein